MNKMEGLPHQPQKRKCQCCKAFGHHESSCPKDPNIRSNKLYDAYDEDERILENQAENKKFNADSSVLTLKMLTEFSLDKTAGKKLMSFDDFQYKKMNTQILNQQVKIKNSNRKNEGDSLDDSDETPKSERESDREAFVQRKLFSDDEICDIEEQQEANAFYDLKDKMETNYIELENMIYEQKDEIEEDLPAKAQSGYQYNFNKEGVNNLINVHDHLDQLVKSREKVADLNLKNQKKRTRGRSVVLIK